MNRMLKLRLALAAGGAIFWSTTALAATTCDRTCLKGIADGVVGSMVAHDPARLDLAPSYMATENAVPAALNMMAIWQTATAAKTKFYVLDPQSQQAFIAVDIAEGPHDALLWGRLKVSDRKLTEIELYVTRSRGDAGFQFDARALAHMPLGWTEKVSAAQLPDRAVLLQAGRSTFDSALPGLPMAASCVLMENGKVVAENPKVLKDISGGPSSVLPRPRNADGTVSIPCGTSPARPTDPLARTDIMDTEQGIVVSIATVRGMVEPYVITSPTQSAFVPDSMLPPYVTMLGQQVASGRYTLPALRPMPASISVANMYRVFDGKVQAMMMLQKLGAVGGQSPWTVK